MPSRGQSLALTYVAWDTVANAGKTGDGANHTLRWVKDGTSAAPDGSPAISEVDSTNAPGLYKVTLDTTDCTCNFGTLCGKSSTSGISIIPVPVTFEQLPTSAAGSAAGALPTVDASNRVNSSLAAILGTALTETTGGWLAAALKKLLNVASPVLTAASINQTGDAYARLGAPAGASISADIASVLAVLPPTYIGAVASVVDSAHFAAAGFDVTSPGECFLLQWTSGSNAGQTNAGVFDGAANVMLTSITINGAPTIGDTFKIWIVGSVVQVDSSAGAFLSPSDPSVTTITNQLGQILPATNYILQGAGLAVQSASSASVFILNVANPAANFAGYWLRGKTGANVGLNAQIKSTTAGSGVMTVALANALPNVPANGDTFDLVSVGGAAVLDTAGRVDLVDSPNPTALGNIAAKVWAALVSGLTVVGSIGKALVAFLASGNATSDTIQAAAEAASAPTVGEIDTQLSGTHGSGAWGAASVVVSPILATTVNPRYTVRDMAPVPQYSTPSDQFTIVDSAGAAVNLSGKTLRLVAYYLTADGSAPSAPNLTDETVTAVFKYELTSGLALSGSGNNVITVTHSATNTATPASMQYRLWNVTDKILLATGKLNIVQGPIDYP